MSMSGYHLPIANITRRWWMLVVFSILAGLNVDFDEVRGRILGRNPIPPIGEVFSEVRREESSTSDAWPKYLWGNVLLIACHLINGMPSRVLQYESPVQVLQNNFSYIPYYYGSSP